MVRVGKLIDDYLALVGLKLATLASATIAAVISVALDIRNHDLLTAIGAVVAGVFVATVATDPTLQFLGLTDGWSQAVAAAYGITGRNLIIWIKRAANDPPATWREFWRGKKDGDA